MAIGTVVVGSSHPERAAALAGAIAYRCETATRSSSPERAMRAGREPCTSAVVIDGFPSGAVLRDMARVTAVRPELGVLVLGPLEPSVEALVALASGASGYLPAGSGADTVAEAVGSMLGGDAVLPRKVSGALLQQLRSGGGVTVAAPGAAAARLTSREWHVFVLLRQGHGTADIARQLVLSKGTVRTHVSALGRKLGTDRSALRLQPAG